MSNSGGKYSSPATPAHYNISKKNYLLSKMHLSTKQGQQQKRGVERSHMVWSPCSGTTSWDLQILTHSATFWICMRHTGPIPYLAAKSITVSKQCLLCQNREWTVSQRHSSHVLLWTFSSALPSSSFQSNLARLRRDGRKSVVHFSVTTPPSSLSGCHPY